MGVTVYINDPAEFFALLCDDTLFVYDAFLINDEVLQVQYRKRDEFAEDSKHSNVIIASYVTCWARLELYKCMEMLGPRLAYCDTDSALFITKRGEEKPPLGSFLGGLTDECAGMLGPGSHIIEYVSCGPKNYAYIVRNETTGETKTVCKIKGITHTIAAARVVHLDSMLNLLTNTITSSDNENTPSSNGLTSLIVPQMRFRVTPFLDIETQYYMKRYQFVYDKRKICPDLTTRPFGYTSAIMTI